MTFADAYVIIIIVRGKPITISGQDGKGGTMSEEMTDKQMNLIIKMILEILEGCQDLEQAKEKIKALLENN